ncbi:hypothetical protein Tco_0061505 [Tanacetum coccineum]
MTAIRRFLQCQSSQSHSSHHNFEINKEQFIPSNGVYGFSSSSNEGISGMYNKYEVPSAHCFPMDKMFAADHGIYSRSYRNMHLNNEVIKSCTEIKSKGGGGKSLIWNNIDLDDSNKMVRFKKKLQILKKEIRSWVNDCKKKQFGRLVDLRSKLCHIDKVIDQGGVNDVILLTRLDLLKKIT